MYKLVATDLAKRFGRRKVFSDISFELETGGSMAVVGPNGSGKTTLLMTLLGGYRPTRGSVRFFEDGAVLDAERVRAESSLVAPYLNLYENLSAEENLVFFATVSGLRVTGKRIDGLLDRVGLKRRGLDLVAAYSSGMKQRLKYAVALLREPSFLFLDEPTSNLDENGKEIVSDIIGEYRGNRIVVIATSEEEERNLATAVCRFDQ
jgi:heme exporter protein A